MRKVEAFVGAQKGLPFYAFLDDPRKIIPLVRMSDISKSDVEFNRPLDLKRVEEIKRYVAGKEKVAKHGKDVKAKGVIPNSPTLHFSDKIKISPVEKGRVWIELPETAKEMLDYKDSIEVIDGQHRLKAFDDPDPAFKNDEVYQMIFVAFRQLSNEEKKEVFMVLNDKQEAVKRNILLRHKKLLGILLEPDEIRYELVEKLAQQDYSPFKDHIIIAGEKRVRGVQLVQFDNMLKKSNLVSQHLQVGNEVPDKAVRALCAYYEAWRSLYEDKWFTPGSTLTKSAGIRFMTHLAPYVINILRAKDRPAIVEEFREIIKPIMPELYNWDRKEAEAYDSKFAYAFSSESATVAFADDMGSYLMKRFQSETKNRVQWWEKG